VNENLAQVPQLIVCNAGGNIPSNIENLNTEDFRHWIENNFLGHLTLVQSVINLMASRGRGKIIFISSLYSLRSKAGRSQYSISKAAQDAYMRSLALEYASKGLIINSVSPGFINTPLTSSNNSELQISELASRIPMARLGDSSEIAQVVSFLASESNTYITGQNLVVDGGYSLQ
jgi:3-oxoacyl-[acyl-carrier protein] reductase